MNGKNPTLIQVREYATLSLRARENSLEFATITNKTFEWLIALIEEKKLDARVGRDYIKLGSQVGYLEVPNGERIEILPKIATEDHLSVDVIDSLRAVLKKMVMASYQMKGKDLGSAHLQSNRLSIDEWIYFNFLTELQVLLKRGFRGDYQQVDSSEKFLKGKLNLNQVMRQRAGKGHYFPQRYDQFNYERIENRLIKRALELIVSQTQSNINWQRANEFVKRLESVSSLHVIGNSFSSWEQSKLMLHYSPILPWCRLILERLNPNFQKGNRQGIAFLFPMERLFEQYVGKFLQRQLPELKVALQKKPFSLLQHQSRDGKKFKLFNLQPDITITGHDLVVIGDTKWKIINENTGNGTEKYGISQGDIYQMLGYGYRYQHEDLKCRNLLLIYPYSSQLTEMLPAFKNYGKGDQELCIWVIPFAFGIENKTTPEGLVIGDNHHYFADPVLIELFSPIEG